MNKLYLGLASIATLAVVAGATVLIGDNTGTQEARCNRFWKSSDEQYECSHNLYEAEHEQSQRAIDEFQKKIDALKR